MKYFLCISLFGLMLTACSDDKTDKVERHVWQDQTDMIDKARDVESMVLDSADKQRQIIDQNSQ